MSKRDYNSLDEVLNSLEKKNDSNFNAFEHIMREAKTNYKTKGKKFKDRLKETFDYAVKTVSDLTDNEVSLPADIEDEESIREFYNELLTETFDYIDSLELQPKVRAKFLGKFGRYVSPVPQLENMVEVYKKLESIDELGLEPKSIDELMFRLLPDKVNEYEYLKIRKEEVKEHWGESRRLAQKKKRDLVKEKRKELIEDNEERKKKILNYRSSLSKIVQEVPDYLVKYMGEQFNKDLDNELLLNKLKDPHEETADEKQDNVL